MSYLDPNFKTNNTAVRERLSRSINFLNEHIGHVKCDNKILVNVWERNVRRHGRSSTKLVVIAPNKGKLNLTYQSYHHHSGGCSLDKTMMEVTPKADYVNITFGEAINQKESKDWRFYRIHIKPVA